MSSKILRFLIWLAICIFMIFLMIYLYKYIYEKTNTNNTQDLINLLNITIFVGAVLGLFCIGIYKKIQSFV